jgi:Spy/CpxP family protein refolding chaperone
MKRHFLLKTAFLLAATVAPFYGAKAQDTPPPDAAKQEFQGEQKEPRPNLLSELGLSREQVQQIRRMNAERKPLMEEANRRLREANRNLDLVIYADSVNDDEFQLKLKEFQAAQAEVARIRFLNELTVRKVLTPEQLVKFREVRQRFAEAMKAFKEQQRLPQGGRPFRRLNQNQPLRPNQ